MKILVLLPLLLLSSCQKEPEIDYLQQMVLAGSKHRSVEEIEKEIKALRCLEKEFQFQYKENNTKEKYHLVEVSLSPVVRALTLSLREVLVKKNCEEVVNFAKLNLNKARSDMNKNLSGRKLELKMFYNNDPEQIIQTKVSSLN